MQQCLEQDFGGICLESYGDSLWTYASYRSANYPNGAGGTSRPFLHIK